MSTSARVGGEIGTAAVWGRFGGGFAGGGGLGEDSRAAMLFSGGGLGEDSDSEEQFRGIFSRREPDGLRY